MSNFVFVFHPEASDHERTSGKQRYVPVGWRQMALHAAHKVMKLAVGVLSRWFHEQAPQLFLRFFCKGISSTWIRPTVDPRAPVPGISRGGAWGAQTSLEGGAEVWEIDMCDRTHVRPQLMFSCER